MRFLTCREDSQPAIMVDHLLRMQAVHSELRTRLRSYKNHMEVVSAGSNRIEMSNDLMKIEKITKMISKMEEYEHEALHSLVEEQVEINLDDNVKVSYLKLDGL